MRTVVAGTILAPLALTVALALPLAPRPAAADGFSFGPTPPPTAQQLNDIAMREFTHRAVAATQAGFVGAFPNFFYATYGPATVGGTVFVKSSTAQWRDVPLTDMGNPPLGDFAERMRAANAYASRNGFVAAFPNYFHANYGRGIVCGTVLLSSAGAVWKDVPLRDLGNPRLDDIAERFRATNAYAVRNGYVGGFPNFYHADYGNGIVCGTVLLKHGYSEWRDVVLSVLR